MDEGEGAAPGPRVEPAPEAGVESAPEPGVEPAASAAVAAVPDSPPPLTVTFRLVNGAVGVLMSVGRVHLVVEGADLLPDRPGVILASNHLSWADPVLLALAVQRKLGRRVRHMAKAEAVAVPVFGTLLRDYGGFAVRRGHPDREAYRMAQAVLAGGDWLGLAPEGTRSRTGGLGEPKAGVALLAMRSGAEIVPTAIWGTERLWPVGKLLPRPAKTVHIRFGEPYRAGLGGDMAGNEAASRSSAGQRRAALDAATEELMRRIAALLPPEYRGRFG